MLYTEFRVKDKDYKLRLNTRNMVALEKLLGCNPLAIFGDGDTMPTVTTMVTILYYSLLQLNHGISLEDAYNIFDSYLEDNSMTDFITIILDIYKTSGLIKNSGENEKN